MRGQRARIDDIREAILSREHERVEARLRDRSGPEQELSLLLRDLAFGGDRERAALGVKWADRALALLDAYEREHAARAGSTTEIDTRSIPEMSGTEPGTAGDAMASRR